MPEIKLGPALPIAASASRNALAQLKGGPSTLQPHTRSLAIETSATFDAGPPPVDSERVHLIRQAIASGNYPVLPVRIADGMIAAGMILGSARS